MRSLQTEIERGIRNGMWFLIVLLIILLIFLILAMLIVWRRRRNKRYFPFSIKSNGMQGGHPFHMMGRNRHIRYG